MARAHANAPPPGLGRVTRRLASVTRGLLAAAALLATLAGLPAALITLVGNPLPTSLPTPDTLTSPVTDQVLINTLAVACWLLWAQFSLAVALELRAALSGRDLTPRLPAGAASQHLARRLVAAVLATGAGGAALTASSAWVSLPPAAAAATLEPAADTVERPPAASAATAGVNCRVYTVAYLDNLWSIAERCLGDGLRYREISTLNRDRTQPDGRQLVDDNLIYPGWVLAVPTAGATTATPDGLTPLAGGRTITVHLGDNLWDLTAGLLGPEASDADIAASWPRLYAANLGVIGDNPHLIHPGQRLVPPEELTGGASSRPEDAAEPSVSVDSPTPGLAESPTASPGPTSAAPQPTPPAPGNVIVPTPDTITHPPPTPLGTAPATSSAGLESEQAEDSPTLLTVAGYGSLLAAGALAALGLRRVLQQRRRRPGSRIRLADTAVSAAELTMRAVEDPAGAEVIDLALRTLSHDCARLAKPLPPLRGVRLTNRYVELILDMGFVDVALGGADPVGPFFPVDGDSSALRCPLDSPSLLSTTEARSAPAPYPALATIGTEPDGSHVLLDLETVGVLGLSGPRQDALEVLRALAVELACSRLADDMDICLVGFGGALAGVLTGDRLRLADTLSEAVDELERWSAEVATALEHDGATTLRESRAYGHTAGVWTPRIVLASEPLTEELADRLRGLQDGISRSSIAAVVTVQDQRQHVAWTVDCRRGQSVRLPDAGSEITLQRLTDSEQHDLIDLLRTASDTTPVAVDPYDRDEPAASDRNLEPSAVEYDGPQILVLGQVTITGASGDVGERRTSLTELAAYLAMNRGADANALAEALWPGRRIDAQTRNSQMSRLRRWLGRDNDGNPYVPLVSDTDGYALARTVGCDWTQFRAHVRRGMYVEGVEGTAHLEAALDLVRGQPFSGTGPRRYGWAEYIKQEMISSVIDAAHELAERRLHSGDAIGARLAASKGLLAAPECELLWRDLLRAEHLAHNTPAVRATLDRLAVLNDDLGVDMEPETIQLATELLGAANSDASQRR